jgi:hypothetical protein
MENVTPEGEVLTTPFFKTPYNHNRDEESARTALYCADPTKTQQHEAEAADINTIVRNFGVTGKLPLVDMPPTIDTFDEEAFDFQSAMNIIAQAKHSFAGMDANVRSAFNNDPQLYVNQIDTWRNLPPGAQRDLAYANMRAMGLTTEPGPIADKTTLGDVLKAIKERANAGDLQPAKGPQTAPGAV